MMAQATRPKDELRETVEHFCGRVMRLDCETCPLREMHGVWLCSPNFRRDYPDTVRSLMKGRLKKFHARGNA